MTTTDVPVASFVEGHNQQVDGVEVRISYGIIERFSEGLYSSPNKAFEELVSNSYDAGAGRVWVSLPGDPDDHNASIAVIDDGDSMDLDGFRELWQIGESPKRQNENPIHLPKGRPPIGKFGIGKLATYVLAKTLTFICCKGGIYRAITMDYTRVTGGVADPTAMRLAVATIDARQAQESLRRIVQDSVALEALFGSECPETWTAAILTDLKGPGRQLQRGRLRWVLSAALPLNPAFALWIDGSTVEPSKTSGDRVWTFTVGESDRDDKKWPYRNYALTPPTRTPAIMLPIAGEITGEAELYKDTLKKGKSEDLGRSHGFFVRVRGRLINLWDETFGIDVELNHGTLTCFRMVIDADGLDPYIASPRESIQDSLALEEVRKYLLAVFNRARIARPTLDTGDHLDLLDAIGRIADPPPALSQAPLRRMLRRAVDGNAQIISTLGFDDDDEEGSLSATREVLETDQSPLQKVVVEPFQDERRLVRYDPQQRAAVLNARHPFINNYLDRKGADEPLKIIGITELLTEAYMLDEDINPMLVQRIMDRRNAFFRALVERHPRSAALISRQLLESVSREDDLEDAVADALRLLGFDVRPISGNGKADGVARARLGTRESCSPSASYSFTYDAKSSAAGVRKALLQNENDEGTMHDAMAASSATLVGNVKPHRIRASTAQTSILRVHREREKADYTLLVAPGFQGENQEESLIRDVCTNDGITPIRIEDLARLVALFPFRSVSPQTLRALFQSRTPEDSKAFVEAVESTTSPIMPPVEEVLRIILEFSELRNPVTIEKLTSIIYTRLKLDIVDEKMAELVRGLAALAPRSLYFDGKQVAFNASLQALRDELHLALDPLSDDIVGVYRNLLNVDS